MIKFFDCYAEDERADKMVKRFVNAKVMEQIRCVGGLMPEGGGFLVPDDFLEFIDDWFPMSDVIADNAKIPVVLRLYQHLECDEEVELTTIEKYVVCKILEEAHGVEMDMFMNGFAIDPLPGVQYLYDVIVDEGIDEEGDCKPADILLIWRNLAMAKDFMFENSDFLFLDLITKEMMVDLVELI